MSKENFDRLMHQLSDQAEIQSAEQQRLKARAARRQKVISGLLTLTVVALFAVAFYKHAEIQDSIAKLIPAHDSEYTEIKKLTRDLKVQNGAATNDQDQSVIQSAKNHAAAVDNAMNVK